MGDGADPTIETRVAATARRAGIALLGMNGMGFYALEHQLAVSGYDVPSTLRAGGIDDSIEGFGVLLRDH